MTYLFRITLGFLFLLLLGGTARAQGESDPAEHPAVKEFLGSSGFGERHEQAPPETEQFGRLVGIWKAEPEMRGAGGFTPDAPGVWVWRYALDGFATQDLWLQSADNLPSYMKNLGRDYLLTSMRVYDPKTKKWNVAWMANGAGKAAGMDFGTFTAEMQEDRILMSSPPIEGMGHQRVIFSEITENSFLWESDYSRDGEAWTTVMRVRASRLQ